MSNAEGLRWSSHKICCFVSFFLKAGSMRLPSSERILIERRSLSDRNKVADTKNKYLFLSDSISSSPAGWILRTSDLMLIIRDSLIQNNLQSSEEDVEMKDVAAKESSESCMCKRILGTREYLEIEEFHFMVFDGPNCVSSSIAKAYSSWQIAMLLCMGLTFSIVLHAILLYAQTSYIQFCSKVGGLVPHMGSSLHLWDESGHSLI